VRLGISRTFQMVKPFYQLPAYKNMIIPLYSPRVKQLAGGRYGDRDAVALDLLEEVGSSATPRWLTRVRPFCPRLPQAPELAKAMVCSRT
jgi:branched-chain amino acid transport system ATP-binding protein